MGTERRPGLHATRLGVLAVLMPVVGWSFANTIVRIAQVPALMFAFYRLWLGALAMVVLLVATRRRLTWAAIRLAGPGGVLFTLNIVFFFAAIKQTKVADVLVIGALQPALTLLVAGRLFGERVTRRELLWVAVSVAGVVVFVLAVWRGLLGWAADVSGIAYPPSALFVLAAFFITVVLLHYSTVISKLSEQNTILAQRLALLEGRLGESRAETTPNE